MGKSHSERRQFLRGLIAISLCECPLEAFAQKAAEADNERGALWADINKLVSLARAKNIYLPETARRARYSLSPPLELYVQGLNVLLDLQDGISQGQAPPELIEGVGKTLSRINSLVHVTPDAFLPYAFHTRGKKPSPSSLRDEYLQLYRTMVIDQRRRGYVTHLASIITKYRARYEQVSVQTAVPWYFIGAIHCLEASLNFQGHLHNGDALNHQTVQVPIGRPSPWLPPSSWEASAVDALTFEHFNGLADWSLPMILYRAEAFNGFGSRAHGIHTPYLWSFSSHYVSGKYVRDRTWSPSAVSQQCGVAVILKEIESLEGIRI